MKHKKDIGKLIKERLVNAEIEPREALWTSIEKTLDKKKKERDGTIWFWSSILVLLTIIFGFYLLNNSEKNNAEVPLSNTEITIKKESDVKNNNPSKVILENTSHDEHLKTISSRTFEMGKKNTQKTTRENSSSDMHISTTQNKISSTKANKKFSIQNGNLVSTNSADKIKDASKKKRGSIPSSTKNLDREKGLIEKIEEEETIVIEDSTKSKSKLPKETPITDVIKKKKKDDSNTSWLVSVHASPTMFGYLNKNLPFDEGLAEGQSKSAISFSYAALVNIPINEKFTFRLGFRNTRLKFNVKEARTPILENEVPAILNDPAIERNSNQVSNTFFESISPPNNFEINQDFSYQEIPFEFLYKISDSNIKIDAIAGLSGMVLKRNNITIANGTEDNSIGSGAYLKKFAFSTSIGLGFRYHLSERVRIDLEPTLKYQFGSFEKDFKNLQPYILNLNMGTTIKL